MYMSENHDRQRALDIVRASSSLPFVSKIVRVDGIPMLDGGIADSIPVLRAIEKGYEHNVVVLTRNKGWRDDGKDRKIPYLYKNYPRLRVALSHRHKTYNEQIQLIDDLEAAGKITCIRPLRPLEVGRIERIPTSWSACTKKASLWAKPSVRSIFDMLVLFIVLAKVLLFIPLLHTWGFRRTCWFLVLNPSSRRRILRYLAVR